MFVCVRACMRVHAQFMDIVEQTQYSVGEIASAFGLCNASSARQQDIVNLVGFLQHEYAQLQEEIAELQEEVRQQQDLK